MRSQSFHLSLAEDGIAILTFDQPGSSANVFNEETLRELDLVLEEVERQSADLTGLVISSGKPSIFIAGADLKQLSTATEPKLGDLIDLGQAVLGRLASLPITTVAAINGACAGGGCELALACDWRVASDSPKTRIGLPETQLGIIPAWGGSTRLPALVGLPTALSIILSGKLFKPAVAKRKGLVDEVVPVECLLDRARASATQGKRRPKRRSLLHNPLGRALIRARARHHLMVRSRGHYPAPLRALEVASRSVSTTPLLSQRNEREAILDLAQRRKTKNLIRLFFLSEQARKLRLPNTDPLPIENATVIGAGVMGAGIAYWLSARGLRITLQDISAEALALGMQRIESHYAKAVKQGVMSKVDAARGMDRIVPDCGDFPMQRMDLVLEAATEDLDIKKKIFRRLGGRVGPETLLASNTSALPVSELADCVPYPEQFVGLHFFNPVPRMKLVEVVRAERSSDQALARSLKFVQRIGKFPVIVNDHPGFLVNRILLPYLVEAANRYADGGDPVAIDRAMLDFGMPMGPLRLLDEVGLDVALHVANTLSRAFPDQLPVPLLMEQMVRRGELGVKSGAGFYLYDQKGPRPNPSPLAQRSSAHALPDDLGAQLARTMVEEARHCLEEGVAESADDIDFAMILGTGFPPFRGGPLRYGEAAGVLRPRRTAEAHPVASADLHSQSVIL